MLQLDPMLIRSTVSWLLWVQRVQQVPRLISMSVHATIASSHHLTSGAVWLTTLLHARTIAREDGLPTILQAFFLPAFITAIGIRFIP